MASLVTIMGIPSGIQPFKLAIIVIGADRHEGDAGAKKT